MLSSVFSTMCRYNKEVAVCNLLEALLEPNPLPACRSVLSKWLSSESQSVVVCYSSQR